jgi:hypothetical protein
MTMAKIPSITLKPCDSSQIHAYGHCPETNVLEIQFKKKGGPGSRYRYQNVDVDTFKAFDKSESKGRFFGEHFKPNADKFPFEKQADE